MENKHSDLDNLFRKNIPDYEYSEKKGNWELMKHLLKEQAIIKKRTRIIQFIFSFLIITSTALFLFLYQSVRKNELVNNADKSDTVTRPHHVMNAHEAAQAKENNLHEAVANNNNHNHSSAISPENNPVPNSHADMKEEKAVEGEQASSKLSSPDFKTSNENVNPEPNFSAYDFYSVVNTYAWGSDSLKIEITNIGKGVNSAYADFAPVISADGSTMYFTSRRPVTDKEIKQGKQALEHIYSCSFNSKKKKWTNSLMLPKTINVDRRNNSAIGLSNDGQRMFIYRDDINGNGDIYESILRGTQWTEPAKLPDPVNNKYHESSASISPDGKTLYFISNCLGGLGRRDIWYCTQDANGKWGKATNVGEPINTKEDEEGIFIHPDGKTIYFSSKGHGGLGGYDLYRSYLEDGKWSAPFNLGTPLNTAGDDVYFVMEANGTTGYYASSKAGGNGEKDIYKVTFTPVESKENKSSKLTLFKGIVVDKETSEPLESEIEITDNTKNESVSQIKSNSVTGKFLVSLPSGKNYGINVKKTGYLFYSDNINVPDDEAYREIIKTVSLEKLKVGTSIILNNIFYDFDKATLRSESVSELERLIALMQEYPSMKIELSSHTDSKGTDEYNEKLSQARAQSVVDYLISKGISKNHMVAKGYGESIPLTLNENADGTDNPEGRKLNRRTEFKILSK